MPSQFTQIHTSKKFRLLTRKSDVAGNEYVYLKGVASTAVGDWVTFDELGVSTRTVASAVGPVAVAMAANTSATNYSWYCIRGLVPANTGAAVADNSKVFLHATAGTVDDASVAGDQVVFAIARASTGGAALGSFQINYPVVGVNVA